MPKKSWEVRLDQNDREKKLERVMARSGANNRAQAFDAALDAYLQLEELIDEEIDDLQERVDDLDGEGISVTGRFSVE